MRACALVQQCHSQVVGMGGCPTRGHRHRHQLTAADDYMCMSRQRTYPADSQYGVVVGAAHEAKAPRPSPGQRYFLTTSHCSGMLLFDVLHGT